MKKKFGLLLAAVGVFAAFAAPSASVAATCNDGTSQARDQDGNVTNTDKVADSPDGGVVYSDQASYLGIVGPHGYIEVSGSDAPSVQVDGQSADGPVEGRGGVSGAGPDLCLNGTEIL